MPVFVLYVKAELENIASVKAKENNTWILTVASPDGSETREGVYVTSEEEQELEGSRGSAHLVIKFKDQPKQASLTVLPSIPVKGKGKALPLGEMSGEQSGEYVPMAAFECRGMEVLAWHPSESDFVVTSAAEGGTEFREVDLMDGEGSWCDYDEKGDVSVSVTDLEHKVEAV